jgi:hypothetical protein
MARRGSSACIALSSWASHTLVATRSADSPARTLREPSPQLTQSATASSGTKIARWRLGGNDLIREASDSCVAPDTGAGSVLRSEVLRGCFPSVGFCRIGGVTRSAVFPFAQLDSKARSPGFRADVPHTPARDSHGQSRFDVAKNTAQRPEMRGPLIRNSLWNHGKSPEIRRCWVADVHAAPPMTRGVITPKPLRVKPDAVAQGERPTGSAPLRRAASRSGRPRRRRPRNANAPLPRRRFAHATPRAAALPGCHPRLTCDKS